MNPIVVTGYVEIPGHPRGSNEYERLGRKLLEISAAPIFLFEHGLIDCWLDPLVRFPGVTHSTGDNSSKNTLNYHVVQHQKTAWILNTAQRVESASDVLVWIDYGIFSQPGITVKVIDEFLHRIAAIDKLEDIFIPGAWEQTNAKQDEPDWHFCGSSLIVPQGQAHAIHEAVKAVTIARLASAKHVTWEINDWAIVEQQNILPIKWYKADHNETQFTNFGVHLVTR